MIRASLSRGAAFLAVTATLAGCSLFSAPPTSIPTVPVGTGSPSAPSLPPTPSPSPTLPPTPTPEPTPVLVAAPLTGRLVTPGQAQQHVIAVMVDDHPDARPQSGFSSASVVWQAPAEGGVPRYMMWFQETVPGDVGPIRSVRSYFITWAAEWTAILAHVGASPQAKAILAEEGYGQLVYNADEFRWGSRFFWRTTDRFAPHNVYTDGKHLRRLGARIGAADEAMEPAWRFGADAPMWNRPIGGRITVSYLYNRIRFNYDRATNTYLRTVSGEGKQYDADTGERVAPKNVIVMVVHFYPLNDGTHHGRLGADTIGKGTAWITTGGRTILGTWKKKSETAPTRFFDADGDPVTLTVGQTFIEVVPSASAVTITAGEEPPPLPGRTVQAV